MQYAFQKSLAKLKIPKDEIDNITKELFDLHGFWGQYVNTIFKGGNLNVGLKDFVKLIKERIGDTLSTEYKIFKDNKLWLTVETIFNYVFRIVDYHLKLYGLANIN